jgi:GH15 family glucan-1,4-alpha-glucosidase
LAGGHLGRDDDVADLRTRSIEVIAAGQAPSGAYTAAPTFGPYRDYCWFRDGSFIADAMSRIWETSSAERFFDWGAEIVRAKPSGPWDTRYRLDGSRDETSWWPHHQLDGVGLWAWATRNHVARHGVASRWDDAMELVTAYLSSHWRDSCVDWWEEREGVHAVTIGSIWAGNGGDELARASRAACTAERLDGSHAFLVALGLVDGSHLERTERELGYHRHIDDEYYGGGEWPILAAFTGWARHRLGLDAAAQLAWIEAAANDDGTLPEQTGERLRPERYRPWVERWGEPALPLLWSHAMYLTLLDVLA